MKLYLLTMEPFKPKKKKNPTWTMQLQDWRTQIKGQLAVHNTDRCVLINHTMTAVAYNEGNVTVISIVCWKLLLKLSNESRRIFYQSLLFLIYWDYFISCNMYNAKDLLFHCLKDIKLANVHYNYFNMLYILQPFIPLFQSYRIFNYIWLTVY